MVQVQKDVVRNQILDAAETLFALVGFRKATMESIAQEAGIATGNVYTYFPNKKALFHAVITDEFVAELYRLTRNRIASFARPGGMCCVHPAQAESPGPLLLFLARNRKKVVILLGWGDGTKYEDFVPSYIREMETQTMEQIGVQFPDLRLTDTFRFMVHHFLVESVQWIVAILKEFETEETVYTAFAATVRYQLAGMQALVEWALSME